MNAQAAPPENETSPWWPSKYGAGDQAGALNEITPAKVLEAVRLADTDLEVQRTFEIDEYTDLHHSATVPHTLVVAPGLVVDKVYVGYWFWGRPSPFQLWEDLQDLLCRTKGDFDPTGAQARAGWKASMAADPVVAGHA